MTIAGFLRALVILVALPAAVGACGDSPAAPTPPPAGAPAPPGVTPFDQRLEISGPREIAPGASQRYVATVYMSDGSSRDVTAQAAWSSNNPTVLAVGADGMTTGSQNGEATLRAALGLVNTSREIIVVPAGTFRLFGTVTEAGVAGYGVAAARVTLTTDRGATFSSTTNPGGRFALYGVAGAARLEIERDGYQPFVESLSVADHHTMSIDLRRAAPHRDVAGTYSLTIAAADSCAVALPAEARSRTYRAVVTQRGPLLTVTLAEASFVGDHKSFQGTIDTDRPGFYLAEWTDRLPSYPEVVERLNASWFIPTGRVTTTLTEQGMAGTLHGVIGVYDAAGGEPLRPLATCESGNHQVVFSR